MDGRAATQRAMLTLALGTLVITLQDPIIKVLMGTYPIGEAIAFRSAVALPIFVVLLRRAGGWRTAFAGRPRAAIVRAALFMCSYTLYFLAFPAMPLADVVALFFTAPLFVVALARPVLGERQSALRWAAVLVGFAGALIVAQPGTGGIGWAALLPIGSAVLYGIGQLLTRRYSDGMSATALSFHQNWVYLAAALVFSAVAAPFAAPRDAAGATGFMLRAWQLPDARDALLLAVCGPIAVVGMILLTRAYRDAPPGAVTPLEYLTLVWDMLWGLLLFAEVPTAATLAGGAIVVASGVVAVTRGAGTRA